jgi:DNA repair protein RecO (recombination protein O)
MDERTIGIIVRTRPLTDTSLIVHWLTRDFGRIATVAKGARRPKSPFVGKLDLFYLAELTFRRSRRSDLHSLSEVSIREFNSVLRTDLLYLQQACYFVNLLEQTTENEAPIPVLFELFCDVLGVLPKQSFGPAAVFAFEIKLLTEHGLQPDLGRNTMSAGAKEILARMIEADWTTLSRLRLAPAQKTEIQQFLHGTLIYHFNRIATGRCEALA